MIIRFMDIVDFSTLNGTDEIIKTFYDFAKEEKRKEIAILEQDENLKTGSKRFIEKSISRGYVESGGTELDGLLPPTSRRMGARDTKKQMVLQKIQELADIFVGI